MGTAPRLKSPTFRLGDRLGYFVNEVTLVKGFSEYSSSLSIVPPVFRIFTSFFRANVSLNKTLSSSCVPTEKWAGIKFRPRVSKGL